MSGLLGGTLFLDEADTISQMAHVKLLDVLQEGSFRRVGGEEDIEVDVRFVAATNMDLGRAQRDGRFRVDLFHRLDVFPLEIPALRNRTDDLPMLASQMLSRLHDLYAKEIRGLDPTVVQAFCRSRRSRVRPTAGPAPTYCCSHIHLPFVRASRRV